MLEAYFVKERNTLDVQLPVCLARMTVIVLNRAPGDQGPADFQS